MNALTDFRFNTDPAFIREMRDLPFKDFWARSMADHRKLHECEGHQMLNEKIATGAIKIYHDPEGYAFASSDWNADEQAEELEEGSRYETIELLEAAIIEHLYPEPDY